MGIALFLWRTIRTQRYSTQETTKPQQDKARPTVGNGPCWSPALRADVPAARSRLTLLPRSPTAPLCTVRVEFPAARLWPGGRSQLPPACQPVLPHMPNTGRWETRIVIR